MLADTARRAFVATVVAGGVIVLALALWKLKVLLSLLFLAFIIAAAMRPGVEALARRGIPRGFGIGIHYIGIAALIGLLLWAVVPRAIEQVQEAVDTESQREIGREAQQQEGWKHDVLVGVQNWLEDLPSGEQLVDPALEAGTVAIEVFIGIFFVLASAAYWIFERGKAVDLVASLLPRPNRKKMRDTWDLIDLKLGAYVRGQGLLIVIVATALSICFWGIGLRYWLLVAVFAGVVELVPVIGPLSAGALAVGVGLTQDIRTAVLAGVAVLVVRLIEDYLIIPRVLGEAVGLSPLLVLFSVTGVAILFGGFAVLLAIPIAAVLGTLVDVIVLDKDPAQEDVPAVLFPAKDIEG